MNEALDRREQEDCPSGEACDWLCDQHERPMTAPTGLATESVEGLAEALWMADCPGDEQAWREIWDSLSADLLPKRTYLAKADRLIAEGVVRPAAEVRAEGAAELRRRIEALIGGPTPPVFLSDRPNKIVRVQHRADHLSATVTESMVRVNDIVAALSTPPEQDAAR